MRAHRFDPYTRRCSRCGITEQCAYLFEPARCSRRIANRLMQRRRKALVTAAKRIRGAHDFASRLADWFLPPTTFMEDFGKAIREADQEIARLLLGQGQLNIDSPGGSFASAQAVQEMLRR